ncbi:MAG TPA: CrcB family protein [Frankiaceae bacterium]|nr:CrcB family protein [Frankiaceae bacterium]
MERRRARRWGEPWGTFAVNVSGSLLLGLLVGLGTGGDAAAALGTGLLGSYTTFSAYAVEVVRGAPLYAGLSVVCGILAAAAGLSLGYGLGG